MKVEQPGALEIARRVLQNCGQIIRYAVAHDCAARNSVVDVRPRKRCHQPYVGANGLPGLLLDIENYIGEEHTCLAPKLMSLTFVRTSELIGARWVEFDMAASRWDISAERMKMKTPHIVPLSTQPKAVLEQMKVISYAGAFVFPSDVDPERPMSTNTLLVALYLMGYRGRMTGHGFRGVASTLPYERGWPYELVELPHAHQECDDISAAYNHAFYLESRAGMMQRWADHPDEVRRRAEEKAKQANQQAQKD